MAYSNMIAYHTGTRKATTRERNGRKKKSEDTRKGPINSTQLIYLLCSHIYVSYTTKSCFS
ncbi:hypothetical protein THOM_2695 [Trachipleistophora hominis]|uniref:Uncharacterized protein n=1 Tax=Trachipleistophora hominis TaxID=72359 RepID=L7JUG3_TRAHO|nr:hypothetical protein THOM_2695 [Trachipleistophora hominis]